VCEVILKSNFLDPTISVIANGNRYQIYIQIWVCVQVSLGDSSPAVCQETGEPRPLPGPLHDPTGELPMWVSGYRVFSFTSHPSFLDGFSR